MTGKSAPSCERAGSSPCERVPANREAFQRWYADREIAELLRHDLEPLTATQSRGYFETFILPSSARRTCFAIHERKSKRLVGTTALTDRVNGRNGVSALFRIVIGEKDVWGRGYGTEATRLMAKEAFDTMGLSEIRLEVFNHNLRAIAAYSRVGFEVTGEHVEWVRATRPSFASSRCVCHGMRLWQAPTTISVAPNATTRNAIVRYGTSGGKRAREFEEARGGTGGPIRADRTEF